MAVGQYGRKMKIVGLIPSRLESIRLPGKALLDICGIPMVIHTISIMKNDSLFQEYAPNEPSN